MHVCVFALCSLDLLILSHLLWLVEALASIVIVLLAEALTSIVVVVLLVHFPFVSFSHFWLIQGLLMLEFLCSFLGKAPNTFQSWSPDMSIAVFACQMWPSKLTTHTA